jgi:5'-phosphate synthase pdxT subunit
MKVGVLALQGAFAEHIKVLQELTTEAVPVLLPSDLNGLNALIIPGGESTTISKLLGEYNLMEPLRNLAMQGFPILGTCAGMVIMSKEIPASNVIPLGIMDIRVQRNAFGRQIDSFEADLNLPVIGDKPFRGIFIRAPVVDNVEAGVEVLCELNSQPVAVKQGKLIACSFHPELTDDTRLHRYVIGIVSGDTDAKGNN